MSTIPKKLYYKIGEVCEICQIEPHVLRYWESEFSALSPTKNKAGQRIYRQKDVELIERMKFLLYDQGFTIAGANKQLQRESASDNSSPRKARTRIEKLAKIRAKLESMIETLSQDLPD